MIITSTTVFEEYAIDKYLGYITGTVARGINFVRETSIALTSILGDRNPSIEEQITLALNEATEVLKNRAICLEADAIIDFSISYNIETFSNGSIVYVIAGGTAVTLRKRAIRNLNV